MNAIIDLQSEFLVDRSKFRDPHLRLLLKAIGRELSKGSAWIVINKQIAAYHGLARWFIQQQGSNAAAA